MAHAKVFKNGNSQAVRLPKEFRFPADTEEVKIHREGERIILEPVPVEEWSDSFIDGWVEVRILLDAPEH